MACMSAESFNFYAAYTLLHCPLLNWTTCLRKIGVDLWTNINLLLGRITKYAQKKEMNEEKSPSGSEYRYCTVG